MTVLAYSILIIRYEHLQFKLNRFHCRTSRIEDKQVNQFETK